MFAIPLERNALYTNNVFLQIFVSRNVLCKDVFVMTFTAHFFKKGHEDRKQERIGRQVDTALKKISVMHVIKLGFAPVSFPPG